ncbi:MAG: CorA family divalent cation transporter [Pseudolabrys sp.]|jgi:zinc transporter
MAPPDLADVAPSTGIVWAYRFAPDGTATPVANDAIDTALAAPNGGWLWVHLALADKRCRAWIERYAPVSELAREVLGGPDQHLQQEFGKTGEELARLRFAMKAHLVVTARQRPLHSVELIHRAIESGKRFPAAVDLIDALIDQFADAIARMAECLGAELDSIEDHVLHEEPGDERQRIGHIRLQSVRIHRQLSQLKGLFQRVEPRIAADDAAVGEAVRLHAQKLEAIDHEMTSLHERARLLLDEMAARVTDTANRRLFTLSILTACLLPPTLVTGFFGMNTQDMPFQHTPGGTWLALAVAFAAGAVSYWGLRRMRAF